MKATSSFSVADDQWPPGFRFHPTDEELVLYYLKRKICRRRLKLDAIAEVDVYKADPDELPGLSKLKTGDRQWFFFSPRDRKYPNGGRSNRATRHGYWKATGKDRAITCNSRSAGIKKTLVFYKGRAPSGERTDWVMHEYTLDEEELKRCPARDYYALYKVYKKSGPGPKNGEQYGAHFREEDWADDEKETVCFDTVQVAPVQEFSEYASFDKTVTNCPLESQIHSLDEFLNQMEDDPFFEPISEQNGIIFPPHGQFNGVQPGFNPTQSVSSQIQETSAVTIANNMNRQGSHNSEENFLEDFLELDDVLGPTSTNQNTEKPVDDLRIEDYDGLCELDLFQDVSSILPNVDTNFGSQISNSTFQSCPNNLQNGIVDQIPNSYFPNFQSETVQPISLPYHDTFGNEIANQFNYQMPYNPDVTSQLWMHNQNSYMSTPAVPNQGSVTPPPSGVLYAGVNQIQNQNQNENENSKGKEGGESWFSSTLWSFVETIPTTPASAAESTALVNKAFERLSSFGRRGDSAKISKINVSANAGNLNATIRRSRSRYNRGFLLFSVLGVLCAILWVFAGTSVRILGSCLS